MRFTLQADDSDGCVRVLLRVAPQRPGRVVTRAAPTGAYVDHSELVLDQDLLELNGLACEFVQDKEGKLLFHTTVGTHVAGREPSWSCNYDAESKLVKSLAEKLCAKQPALKIFQRSSMLPSMSGPMPSPQRRVKYRQQAQREIDELLTPRPPSSPSKPTTPPIEGQPRTPGGGRLRTPGRPATSASGRSAKADPMLGSTLGSEAYQTALLDTQQSWTLDDMRTSTPGRLHTLASLRHYQVETLKDALQEQFASATQAELERLQEANRREQATRECETMHEAYAELQRYHDGEMEKASTKIADLSQQLHDQTAARQKAEDELAKRTEERDFARADLAAERTAHDEKTLGHGGRIHELEQELMALRSTLGANGDRLTEENERLRRQMQEEREEIGALNEQLVKFSNYIEQLEGTRDEQLQLITDLRAERGDLLLMTPADRSSYAPKDKTKVIRLNINDLLCREINPVAEMGARASLLVASVQRRKGRDSWPVAVVHPLSLSLSLSLSVSRPCAESTDWPQANPSGALQILLVVSRGRRRVAPPGINTRQALLPLSQSFAHTKS